MCIPCCFWTTSNPASDREGFSDYQLTIIPTALSIIFVLGGVFLLLASCEVIPPFPNAISQLEGGAAIGALLLFSPVLCFSPFLLGRRRAMWHRPYHHPFSIPPFTTQHSYYGSALYPRSSFSPARYPTPRVPSAPSSSPMPPPPYRTPSVPPPQ